MSLTNNNFWVLYGQHTKPTLVTCEEKDTQPTQRKTALQYVERWKNCIDIGSNVGMWTRELAQKFKLVYCFEPNPNFNECFRRNITENNVKLFEFGLSNKKHTGLLYQLDSLASLLLIYSTFTIVLPTNFLET